MRSDTGGTLSLKLNPCYARAQLGCLEGRYATAVTRRCARSWSTDLCRLTKLKRYIVCQENIYIEDLLNINYLTMNKVYTIGCRFRGICITNTADIVGQV